MISLHIINATIDRILLVPINSLLSLIEVLYYLINLMCFSHSTFTQLTLRLCTSLIILSLPSVTENVVKAPKKAYIKDSKAYSRDMVITLMNFMLLFCEFSFIENIKWGCLSQEDRETLIFDFTLEALWRLFILDFMSAGFIGKVFQAMLSVRLLSVLVQNDWHIALRFRFLCGGILIGLAICGVDKLKNIKSCRPLGERIHAKQNENQERTYSTVCSRKQSFPINKELEANRRHTEGDYSFNSTRYVQSNPRISFLDSSFNLDESKPEKTSTNIANLASVLDFLPEGVIVLDTNAKVQFTNQYMRNIFEFDGKVTLEGFSKSLSDFRFREAFFQNSFSLNVISETSIYSPKHKSRKLSHGSASKLTRAEFLQRIQRISSLENLITSCIANPETRELVESFIPTFQTRYYQQSTNEWYTIELKVYLLARGEKQFIILLRDITDRENKFVALEKEKTLYRDNLIASFSHELRTPLNSNLAFLEQSMSSAQIPPDVKRDLIKPALDSGRLLLFMVNNILDYSLVILNKLRLDIKPLDIIKTVNQCMELFESKATQKKLQLTLLIEEDVPLVIFSDHKRVSQVLVNLLSNALQFTTQGEIRVTISKPSEQTVRITVEDTGIGMEVTAQERLVRSLSNEVIREKLSEASVGSGLGLFISNKLVKNLNSKGSGIRFKSNSNKGSKFYFDIEDKRPKDQVTTARPRELVLSELDEKCDLANRLRGYNNYTIKNGFRAVRQLENEGCQVTALVVDDEIFNITVIENYCKSLDIMTDKAFNGKEALDKLRLYSKNRSNAIKIVFMDINMPLMDGYESTIAILDMIRNGEIEDVIIVGVTAYVSRDMIEKGLECGMVEVLNKPVTKEALAEVLRRYKLIN